jgi:hypothetical protein
VLKAGYENQAPFNKLIYENQISYPRGYESDLVAEKLLSFSADYTMPLFYPDFAAGSMLYLKRIRGSLFFDGATANRIYNPGTHSFSEGSLDFSSFGAELLADFYILRFPFEISAGASGGYIPADNKLFIRGVLSVNIYGTTLGKER